MTHTERREMLQNEMLEIVHRNRGKNGKVSDEDMERSYYLSEEIYKERLQEREENRLQILSYLDTLKKLSPVFVGQAYIAFTQKQHGGAEMDVSKDAVHDAFNIIVSISRLEMEV